VGLVLTGEGHHIGNLVGAAVAVGERHDRGWGTPKPGRWGGDHSATDTFAPTLAHSSARRYSPSGFFGPQCPIGMTEWP